MISVAAGIAAAGFGLAALLFALLGLHLRLTWRGGRQGALLLCAVGASLVWALCALGFVLAPSSTLWLAAGMLDGVRVLAWLLFLFSLLELAGEELPPSIARVRQIAVGLVLLRVGVEALGAVGLQSGAFATQMLDVLTLASAVAGLVTIEQLYRNFPEQSRWGIKPLAIGLLGAFFFDIYVAADAFMFRRPDLTLWGVRGFVWALAMALVAVSAGRSRNWNFRISVSREVVFHSATLGVAGSFLLAVAAAGYWVRYFGGAWGGALQALLLFGGLLGCAVVLFSGSFRARLRVFLSKHFFSYRYDYRAEWLRFTTSLAVSGGSADLSAAVIGGLADLVESPGGVLWLRDRSDRYIPFGRLNHVQIDAAEPGDGDLVRFLQRKGWIVDLAQARSQPSLYEGFSPPAWIEQVPDAWLIVPLFVENELVGFVVLMTARTPVEVDWEVLDLLKTASRQAAVHLGRHQAAEALLEAQKFDAFNRMSAFVVHDLKNLVAQLQLMLRNAERHGDNPEFQRDMLDTVRHVQERMQGLMGQLQEKRSIDIRKPVALAELARRIADSKRHQRPVVGVTVDASPIAMAHPERIERVLGHLVQNALDATGDDGIVGMRVFEQAGMACVEVGDSGSGMSPQFVRERLFKPFQSTKDAGMGIGAYETLQYVTELGGRIEVKSEIGRGTTMHVWLPCLHDALAPEEAA
ncbi:PEP-CTERM system histidine kinase PrsK [Niveibacterium sp. 24ML]|uniref:XrtA/PEP-CTERM system histidine kinase PrsK n=1 Tax=Niveibacterium sp. 24ML TaxID=2985512 RepID=UPI002271BE15|nr:XrtA/PEP-CTERM system histidine kinase PrsK [Niveibacterium sp. 24ML]MCX9156916.1 PEP-CTERM system histidine kinase PrsK [Niveibacterium sp. 24ML]